MYFCTHYYNTKKQLSFWENSQFTEVNDGSQTHPFTVAEALAIIEDMTNGAIASEPVYVKGIVTDISEISTTYYNATYLIADNETAEVVDKITVFRGLYLGGQYFVGTSTIKVKDEVIVYGKLQKYFKDENLNITEIKQKTTPKPDSLNNAGMKIKKKEKIYIRKLIK